MLMKLRPPDTDPIPWARPAIDAAERQAVIDCMDSGWLTAGPRVAELERRMAERARRRFAVAVGNGTAALDVALRAAGVRRDDEVIVPALSYVATASAVALQGAVPIFADVDRRTLGLSADRAEERLTSRTRAVLCTDHGGNPCDYGQLTDLTNRAGVPLIVDGAQSLGAAFGGRPTLSYGLISTVSFHAAKTITTVEGGMCFTDDPAIDRKMRLLRSHGEDPDRKYHHVELGHNFRMTELQAAIGVAQLGKVDALLAGRQAMAATYAELLAGSDLWSPPGLAAGHNGRFLYTVMVPHRDAVMARLKELGIETRACYPVPLYRQPIFARMAGDCDCPVTEAACAQILNPPMFHGLTAEQQARVVHTLTAVVADLSTVRLRKAV